VYAEAKEFAERSTLAAWTQSVLQLNE